jgi:hypothetical protein
MTLYQDLRRSKNKRVALLSKVAISRKPLVTKEMVDFFDKLSKITLKNENYWEIRLINAFKLLLYTS